MTVADPAAPFVIVEAIYPGMTQLDFTGPHTIFSRLPNVVTMVASEQGCGFRRCRHPIPI
jgi:hypothetical protein